MTKNEFMTILSSELKKKNISDAGDIIDEYEQHFAFKLSDGYSEEEIAARLGDPAALAAQFCESDTPKKGGSNKVFAVIGLIFADIIAVLFFILLAAFELVMAAAGISFAGIAVCLVGGFNICGLIPAMPYLCGVIIALAFAALTSLIIVGCVYYGAFLHQIVRAFSRLQKNTLASASGSAVLPPLSIVPQFSAAKKRRLRNTALVSLILFAAFFVLSVVVCTLSASSLEFWHAWNWFTPEV